MSTTAEPDRDKSQKSLRSAPRDYDSQRARSTLIGKEPTLARFEGWRTSSRSGTGGQCVEVGHAPGFVGIRDTKNRDGGTLTVRPDAFGRFVAALKTGQLG